MKPSAQTSRPRLRLSDHVRACAVGDQVILLDLKRNRYLGMGSTQCHVLAELLEDWPRPEVDSAGERAEAAIPAMAGKAATGSRSPSFLGALIRQGLITSQPGPLAPTCRTEIDEASASLDVLCLPSQVTSPRCAAVQLCEFVAAAALTSYWLRCRSLMWITTRVAARRHQLESASHDSRLHALRERAMAFESLRPMLFTARDRCLYDSLALLSFLARHRHFPKWVVGVRTQPFAAHSWLQEGPLVLNDLHENVRPFSPILVV